MRSLSDHSGTNVISSDNFDQSGTSDVFSDSPNNDNDNNIVTEKFVASPQAFLTDRSIATPPAPYQISSAEPHTPNLPVVPTPTGTTNSVQPEIISRVSYPRDRSLMSPNAHSKSSLFPIPSLRTASTGSMSHSDIGECTNIRELDERELFKPSSPRRIAPRRRTLLGSSMITKDIERRMESWAVRTKEGSTSRRKSFANLIKWGNKLWLSYFFFVSLAILIQLTLGLGDYAFPDGHTCYNEEGQRINTQICNAHMCLKEAVAQLYFLSPFILGGFLVSSLSMWRARRRAYAMLCGGTRNILVNLCTIISDPNERRLVSRWAVLGYELAVLKGRGLIDTDEGRDYLESLNLIQSNEWDVMVSGDRHTTVWYWIQMKAMTLTKTNSISQIEFQTICNAVTLLRDKANDIMSCLDRDQPPPYISLCATLVNINLFLHTCAMGVDWAMWMHELEGDIWGEPRTYMQVVILFLYTTIYAMLFDVCGLLYNPFGPREIDVNHYEISKGIRKLASELSTNSMIPKTMNNVHLDGSISNVCDVSIEQQCSQMVQQRS